MAYPLVAAIVASVTRLLRPRVKAFPAALIACHVAMALLFVSGAGWFMHYTHHNLYTTWIGAVAPFLPGEIVKAFAAAGIYSALTRSTRT